MSVRGPNPTIERGAYSAIVFQDGDFYVAEDNVGTKIGEHYNAATVIQIAIDALGTGDTLFLKDDFAITSLVDINQEGLKISGSGRNTLSTSQDISIFKITADNVCINDLKFQNTHGSPTTKLISIEGTVGDRLDSVSINNCHVSGANKGICALYSDRTAIRNCRVNDGFESGIIVEYCTNSSIYGCNITNPGDNNAIRSLKSDFSVIEGNHITDTCASPALTGIIICCGDMNTIINNTVEGCKHGIVHGSYYATADYGSIIGNHITDAEYSGIWLCGSGSGYREWGVIVAYNTAINNGEDGIRVGSSLTYANNAEIGYSSISENILWYNGGYGIKFVPGTGSILKFRIRSNDIAGNTTGAFSGLSSVTLLEIENNIGYNPVGVSGISVGASPYTYTSSFTSETIYIYGGTVSAIKKDGTTLFTETGHSVNLEPIESLEVTYSVLPTMIKDIH